MTIGLLGGTFDPPHLGHLDVAAAARRALALDEVWFVPARQPPHRASPVASAAHRFAMAALAVSRRPGLRVCDAEMEVEGPSYSIDTVRRVLSRNPAVAGSLFFITGADAFLDIETWREWRQLLDLCHFAVVSRPGCSTRQVRNALTALAARMHDVPCTVTSTPGIFLIEADTADVSSTRVRETLRAGRTGTGLLPERVAEYAVTHGLYSGPARQESSTG